MKIDEPSAIGGLIITTKYDKVWVQKRLPRFQETRSFLESWQPL